MIEQGSVELSDNDRGIWEVDLPQITLPDGAWVEILLNSDREERL